jgi:hypothetical protein
MQQSLLQSGLSAEIHLTETIITPGGSGGPLKWIEISPALKRLSTSGSGGKRPGR